MRQAGYSMYRGATFVGLVDKPLKDIRSSLGGIGRRTQARDFAAKYCIFAASHH
jgi:hypothetical protein